MLVRTSASSLVLLPHRLSPAPSLQAHDSGENNENDDDNDEDNLHLWTSLPSKISSTQKRTSRRKLSGARARPTRAV
jgi:hypothetical protein